jgi:O-antigen/teichoic acid export membrane protein
MTGPNRASAALALGSVVSGLLAYLLFALITRGLGAEDAAPVTVLWTHWAFTGAAFTFPLQHWITRSLVAGQESAVRRAAPRISLVIVVVALVLGALSWLARDDLFHRDDPWFPVMIALITVGSALIGVVRGGLGGRGRFEAVAWSLVAENGLRCVLVAGLLLAGVTSAVAHGLCLVAGQVVVVLWPSALRYASAFATRVHESGSPLAFLGGAAVAQLISQAILTGGPVLLALSGGSPSEVTAMFAALALFRAPYMIVLGSVPQLTLRVTQRTVAGEYAALRTMIRGVLAATVGLVLLAGLLGAWVGPSLLRLVFGHTVDVPATDASLLAIGCALAIANLALMVIALGQDRPAAVARAWAIATVVGAVGFVALTGTSPVDSTIGAFLAAEVAALTALSVATARATQGAGPRA